MSERRRWGLRWYNHANPPQLICRILHQRRPRLRRRDSIAGDRLPDLRDSRTPEDESLDRRMVHWDQLCPVLCDQAKF